MPAAFFNPTALFNGITAVTIPDNSAPAELTTSIFVPEEAASDNALKLSTEPTTTVVTVEAVSILAEDIGFLLVYLNKFKKFNATEKHKSNKKIAIIDQPTIGLLFRISSKIPTKDPPFSLCFSKIFLENKIKNIPASDATINIINSISSIEQIPN